MRRGTRQCVGTRVVWMRGGDPCGRPSCHLSASSLTRRRFHRVEKRWQKGKKDAHKGPLLHPSSTRVPTDEERRFEGFPTENRECRKDTTMYEPTRMIPAGTSLLGRIINS